MKTFEVKVNGQKFLMLAKSSCDCVISIIDSWTEGVPLRVFAKLAGDKA